MNLAKKLVKYSLLVAAFLGGSSWASGAVIYNESVSGDLSTFDPIVLNLTAGTNSVLGSSEYTDLIADFDGFNISLGAGQTLTSIEYFISNRAIATDTTSLDTNYTMRSGGHGGTHLAFTSINVLGASPQSMFPSALPVSGVFAFGTTPSSLGRSGSGGTWDYEIRFTVSEVDAVPEPSTLTTLGIGGLGLAFAALRRYRFRKVV